MKNKRNQQLGILGLTLLLLVGLVSPALATAGDGTEANPYTPSDRIVVCHATSSSTNPYVRLLVSASSVGPQGHGGHADDAWEGYWFQQNVNDPVVQVVGQGDVTVCTDAPSILTATAVNPTVTQSTVCGVQGYLTIPSTTGVVYRLNGEPRSGTVPGPIVAGTVTATAELDYQLTNPGFSFAVDIPAAATDCGGSTNFEPDPQPEVSANLLAGEICPIDVNLIDYLVEGENWTTGTLTVLVDGAVVATYTDVAPGAFGTLDWPLDADGQPYATVSLSLQAGGLVRTVGPIDLDETCAEVGGVVIVTPTPVDTEPEPTDEEPVVKGEVVTLPETGVPALLLTLLGLLSMGAGGALLRRRP
jgi:LPXTG-motif cell wall-anchored protein